jgi:O-methyltransferase
VFETLQVPGTPKGGEVRAHFKAVHGNSAEVARLLGSYPGIHLHPGVFPDSACPVEEMRFSFVHLDMDLPASTRDGLAFFHPRMVPGGILIGDDYQDPGVRDCFAAWFDKRDDTLIPLPWGQVMVVKQREAQKV